MNPKLTRFSGLVMDVRPGDTISLGGNIKIHVLEKSGRVARMRVAAPLDVRITKETEDGKEGLNATPRQAD